MSIYDAMDDPNVDTLPDPDEVEPEEGFDPEEHSVNAMAAMAGVNPADMQTQQQAENMAQGQEGAGGGPNAPAGPTDMGQAAATTPDTAIPDFHPLAAENPGMQPDQDYQVNNQWADATGGLLDYAIEKMKEYGWGPQHIPALIGLWNETASPYTQSHTGTAHWDPNALNIMSGASGIPGIPEDTIESLGDPSRWNEPKYQIDLGLEYIKGTYDNPTNAWNTMRLQNWY